MSEEKNKSQGFGQSNQSTTNKLNTTDIEDNQLSGEETAEDNNGRRKALKSILAGGGAVTAATTVEKWGNPVIDSIVLPAHAQTSGDTTDDTTDPPAPVVSAVGNFTSNGGITLFNPPFDPDEPALASESISEELLEFFIPAANAQSGGVACNNASNCSVNIDITVDETSGSMCLSGDLVESAPVFVNTPESGTPTLGVNGKFSTIFISGGEFNESTGNWELDVIDGTNTSVVVQLTPGGDGCSAAD